MPEGEPDHRFLLAREVWRRGQVRQKIVDAVRLAIRVDHASDRNAKRKSMAPEEIAVKANGILATETKLKRSVKSKNDLSRKVGCSPNAAALIEAWGDYRKAGGGSYAKGKSLSIDDGIGKEDSELERLILEQEKEVNADLRLPRSKNRARTAVDD
jgi:hypothetical protein